MSNRWKKIWNEKGKNYKISLKDASEFAVYKELKRLLKNRGIKVGGIDYSKNLSDIARDVISEEENIETGEAINLSTDEKYDMVFSDGVFAYFPDEEYGKAVLYKMFQKARKLVVVSEIFDKDMQFECERHRRELFDNYDEAYKGLDKVFYKREMFIQFAEKRIR